MNGVHYFEIQGTDPERVARERSAVPGRCWQGYFIDCDSNVFGIFEVDQTAA